MNEKYCSERGLYRKLRGLREENYLTLEEVRLATGLSIGFLHNLETGKVLHIKNATKRENLQDYIRGLEKGEKIRREIRKLNLEDGKLLSRLP
ncbi:MAG: hypothetical protein Q8P15_03165 [Nanoarchaeota archaeon]|nr:hypothetical protein [Nanoarchaeota archaeon]